MTMTKEHREKIAEAQRRRWRERPDLKAAYSQRFKGNKLREGRTPHNKGVPCPQGQRERIAAKLRGSKLSPAVREKVSAALKGRVLSEAHRAAIRAARSTPASRAKTAAASREAWRRNPSRVCRTGPKPAEERARISATLKGHVPAPGSGVGKQSRYNGAWMRSTYELRFATALDRLGVAWQHEPERFRLPDGSSYAPDFYLPTYGVYVEVKGYFAPRAQEKVRLFATAYRQERLLFVFQPELRAVESASSFALSLLRDGWIGAVA